MDKRPKRRKYKDNPYTLHKENGKFYDDKGNEVDEKTWNAKCVPGTGSFAPYISILTLLLASYGIINIINYYKNNKKIYKV